MAESIQLSNNPEICLTEFPSGTLTNGRLRTMTVSELFELLKQHVRTPETMAEYQAGTQEQRSSWKGAAGGITMASFTGNYRNGKNYQYGYAVMLDIEKIREHTGVKVTQDEVDEAIRKRLPYCLACYSSHSNTDEDPRRRLCVILTRPVSKAEMELVTREIARQLNIEWADHKCFAPQQLMYLPSCSKDATPVTWHQDGPLFDVDRVLNGYTFRYGDWRDVKNWPRPSFERYVSGDKTLTDPTEKPGWIGAYNRVYDVERAMDEEIPGVYEETILPGRWKFFKSSNADGAKVCDDFGHGSFLCSFHESDPANGVHHAFDLVRIHKYGNMDDGLPEDTPMQNRPSYKAMIEHCQTLPEVVAEWAKENAVGASEFDGINPTELRTRLFNKLKELHPEKNARYGWHDAGNGNLFADLCFELLCYVPERKKWYHYDGVRWIPDEENNAYAMNYCKLVAGALMDYAMGIEEERLRTDYIKHVAKWQGFKYRETILKESATVLSIIFNMRGFDTDPYLLNCLNGTLNLQSGEFREHSSTDRLTKLANVEYRPECRCERWEQYISEAACGKDDLIEYLQKALGYALTGDTRYECFFILYGATSRNGKGTLCETIMRLMGDYGLTVNPETIATRKNIDPRSASGDIARLQGARFVNISEPDKNMMLNAALIKTLTGNDTVTARNLFEREFEFRFQGKLFINSNYLPSINDRTLFASGRVKVIPFNRHFNDDEQDRSLKSDLLKPESLSGILNWCLSGWNELQRTGLKMPPSAEEATQDYEKSEDAVGRFIDEMLLPVKDAETDAKAVYSCYKEWCWGNDLKPGESLTKFMEALNSAGIEAKRGRPKGSSSKVNKSQMIYGYTCRGAGL